MKVLSQCRKYSMVFPHTTYIGMIHHHKLLKCPSLKKYQEHLNHWAFPYICFWNVVLRILVFRFTWIRSFFLNNEGFEIWTKYSNITEVKTTALNLESPELRANLLEAVDNVLHHDVLQGQEGKSWPVSEHSRIETAGIVTAQEHRLQVGTTVGWKFQ